MAVPDPSSSPESRTSPRRRLRSRGAVVLGCIAVFSLSLALVAAIYYFADPTAKPDTMRHAIALELAKVLTQLAVIGVVGAVVKFLLDEYTASRRSAEAALLESKRRQDAQEEFKNGLWRDLRAVFAQVEKSRHLIEGAKSAKTYDTEIRTLMDTRTQLGKIRHQVDFSADTFRSKAALSRHLRIMEKYLDLLIDEYGDSYKTLSELQRQYERERETQGRSSIDMGQGFENLPVLGDFLQAEQGGSYDSRFRLSYYRARQAVLAEFERTLRIHGPITPEAEQEIRDAIRDFTSYLRSIGARFGASTTVKILPTDELDEWARGRGFNARVLALYDTREHQLMISTQCKDHLDVVRREFCHRVFHGELEPPELLAAVTRLQAQGPAAVTGALISGLSFYLPCSLKNDSHFAPQVIGLDLQAVDPDPWRDDPRLKDPAFARWAMIDSRGRRWAGTFWKLRGSHQAVEVDRALVRAWNETPKSLEETRIDDQFVRRVVAGLGREAQSVFDESRLLV